MIAAKPGGLAPLLWTRSRRLLLLPILLAIVTGCHREPGRFDEVQKETRHNAPAVAKEALPGSTFNKLFPKAEGDFDVVFAQEKKGFAEAKLVKKGVDVASLAIFDTLSNPEAAAKYKDTTDTFQDFPIMETGKDRTGLLVNNRFQVQIRSLDASFSKFDREDWFKKFDLANLAKLQ